VSGSVEGATGSISPSQWEIDTTPLREGDRVLAAQAGGWLYPGTVEEVRAGELLIWFDRGQRASIPADKVRRLYIGPGRRVFCRWMGGATYYSDTVKQRNGDAVFIHYDDGDKEWNQIALIRMPAHAGAAFFGGAVSLLLGRVGCLIWIPLAVGIYILFRFLR
jgi:hypothetical protein